MKDLIIVGAGGLGRKVFVCLRRLNTKNKWNILGFIDDDFIQSEVKKTWLEIRDLVNNNKLVDVVERDKFGNPIINKTGLVRSATNFPKSKTNNLLYMNGLFQDVVESLRHLVVATHQSGVDLAKVKLQPCILQGTVKRDVFMGIRNVVAVVLGLYGHQGTDGVVCRLHEICRLQQLFSLF